MNVHLISAQVGRCLCNIMKISWLIHRLRAMSPGEIIWRIKENVKQQKEKKTIKGHSIIYLNKENNELYFFDSNKFFEANVITQTKHNNCSSNIIKKAQDICDGNYDIFGESFSFGQNIDWFYGFNTNNKWPMKCSYDIDFRRLEHIGDVRYIWEFNRHYQFVVLVLAYKLTREEKYLNEFIKQFYDWVDKNPMLMGINWTSAMEVAIRAYSWSWCLALLDEPKGNCQELIHDLKSGILNHINYVTSHFSRYSSANNHLIVEAAITGCIGIAVDNLHWIKLGCSVIEKELGNQVYEDGVNKEQAIHYHAFVMEAVMLFIILLKKNNVKYPLIFDERLEKMNEFITDLMNTKYEVPNIGDSDDGHITNLCGDHFNYYEYVLQIGSLLFEKEYIQFENINRNLIWLFKESAVKQRVLKEYSAIHSKVYADGGYSILKHRDSTSDRLCTFDHGPLGYGALAAHGHADALNITLSINGHQFIVDPGTYIYNIDKSWRDYFRSTINHNTITINGVNQSEIKGSFLWGRKAQAKLLCAEFSDEKDFVMAHHDGYKDVMHERSIVYFKPDCFVVEDYLKGTEFQWVLNYNLDKKVCIDSIEGSLIKLHLHDCDIYMSFYNYKNLQIKEKFESLTFGNKRQIKSIELSGFSNEEHTVSTIITIQYPHIVEVKGNRTYIRVNEKEYELMNRERGVLNNEEKNNSRV